MSSNMTPMEVGILLVQFSAVPDSERAGFLRQHPEIRSAWVVDWALTAARLREQMGEPEAKTRLARAALYIAIELGDHERQASARELLIDEKPLMPSERKETQATDDDWIRPSHPFPRRAKALATTAAELMEKPSLRRVAQVMLKHPDLFIQALGLATRLIVHAVRDPAGASARVERVLAEELDETSLRRVDKLACHADQEGDHETAARLRGLPAGIVGLSTQFSSTLGKAFALQVFDFLTVVATAESESAARQVVRRNLRLALQSDFLPVLMQVREFCNHQPDPLPHADTFITLILGEVSRALSEMDPHAVGLGGACTALRLADSPQSLEACLLRYAFLIDNQLFEELERISESAEARGLPEFASQTRILAEMIRQYLNAPGQAGDLQDEMDFIEHLALGEKALARGLLQKALDSYQLSLAIAEKTGNSLAQAYALNNLGLLYTRLNQWVEAEQCLAKAQDMARQASDRGLEALAVLNLGNSYAAGGNRISALECYERVRHVAEELGNRQLEAQALGSRGRVYEAQRYFQAALFEYEQALQLQRATEDRYGEAVTLANMANSYTGLESFAQALLHYDEALSIASEAADPDNIARVLAGRAIAYIQLKRFAEARGDLERSIKHIEETRSGLTQEEHRMSYFGWDKIGVYRNLVLLLAGRDHCWNPREAFEMVERSRSRGLLDQLGYTELRAPHEVDPFLLHRERELAMALRAQAMATRQAKTEEQRQELATQVARLQTEWDAILDQMQAQTPEYVALRRGEPASWEGSRKCLSST